MADRPYDGPKRRPLETLNVDDVIEWRDFDFGHHHRWRVVGVHLGAAGPKAKQESVVALENVSHTPAWDEVDLIVMHVPFCLLRQCRIVGRYKPDGAHHAHD